MLRLNQKIQKRILMVNNEMKIQKLLKKYRRNVLVKDLAKKGSEVNGKKPT